MLAETIHKCTNDLQMYPRRAERVHLVWRNSTIAAQVDHAFLYPDKDTKESHISLVPTGKIQIRIPGGPRRIPPDDLCWQQCLLVGLIGLLPVYSSQSSQPMSVVRRLARGMIDWVNLYNAPTKFWDHIGQVSCSMNDHESRFPHQHITQKRRLLLLWHRKPCPEPSCRSQRKSPWFQAPSLQPGMPLSMLRCSCRLSCQLHGISYSQPCQFC